MKRSLSVLSLIAALGASAGAPSAQTSPATSAATSPAAANARDASSLLAASQARLAWSLLEHANADDPVVSPASLAAAFDIINGGADARMKAAMAKALGFGAREKAHGFAALAAARKMLSGDNGGLFQSANLIVFAPGSPPSEQLRAKLEREAIATATEDLSKPEGARKVDDWVKEITRGAIPEILGGPLEGARFVALNALHFKGKWKTPFNPALTSEAPFKGADGKTENVMMMRLAPDSRAYRVSKEFVGVELPFDGDRFSLVVVTSTDRPRSLKEFAGAGAWLSGAGFEDRKGDLALPRFSVSARTDLLPALDKMGLAQGRRSPTALAGFGKGTQLSQVLQRAMIDVDEEGAEAAAATAIIGMRSLAPDDSIHMNVDKPFIYALRDRETGLVLIAGYVGHAPRGKGG